MIKLPHDKRSILLYTRKVKASNYDETNTLLNNGWDVLSSAATTGEAIYTIFNALSSRPKMMTEQFMNFVI